MFFCCFFLSTAEVECFLFSTKYLLIAVQGDVQATKETGFHGHLLCKKWWFIFFPQLRSTQRCITPASSLSPTLLHYASWSWPIFRYVTSCGFSRSVILMIIFFNWLFFCSCKDGVYSFWLRPTPSSTDTWKHISDAEEVEVHAVLGSQSSPGRACEG